MDAADRVPAEIRRSERVRSIRTLVDEMEGLARFLREVCEHFENGSSTMDEDGAMLRVDAELNRIMATVRRLTPSKVPSISIADRSRWQDEIAKLAAERVKFIIAGRERLLDAWVSETGCKPSESELVEQHDPDGSVRVTVHKKPQVALRRCRHGFVGRCPYREQDPPIAGWIPEDDCHGPAPR